MKTMIFLSASILLAACAGGSDGEWAAAQTATSVTVTHARQGGIAKETILTATTSYQNKTALVVPVPAFVTGVRVKPGDRVRQGDSLFQLVSKEQHAIDGAGAATIAVGSPCDGVVLDVQVAQGSYAAEGSALCTVADAGSLVFEINVPCELAGLAAEGQRLTIELPDGRRLEAVTRLPLAVMDVSSQSQRVVAVASACPFLPEGMRAKAIFVQTSGGGDVLVLPKSAVQSDESLSLHWVMVLRGGGVASMVRVTTGNSTSDSIEVFSPDLSPRDSVIESGSYGLADGARVVLMKQ